MTKEEMEKAVYDAASGKVRGIDTAAQSKVGYTKRMADHNRKLEIAKKVALILSENRARVDDLHDIFSLAQRQLSVSILPESEQSQRFSDTP